MGNRLGRGMFIFPLKTLGLANKWETQRPLSVSVPLTTTTNCSTTPSADLVTLLRPPVQSRLRITNRSFRHTASQLWNKLPHSLRVPYQSGSSLSSPLSSGSNPEPAVNLSHGMFHSRLKTYLFSKSFPP